MIYTCMCGKVCSSEFNWHTCIDQEFQVSPTKKYLFHDDLGWGIYVKHIGNDWERESDVTIQEAVSEYRKWFAASP